MYYNIIHNIPITRCIKYHANEGKNRRQLQFYAQSLHHCAFAAAAAAAAAAALLAHSIFNTTHDTTITINHHIHIFYT